MKTLILTFSLILSLSAFAEQGTDFQHRANCKMGGSRLDSKLSEVSKVSEDADSAVFRLKFEYGYCDNIDDVQGPIKIQRKMVQVGNYGFSYPGKKTNAKVVSFKALSETELEAEISVKKDSKQKRFILDIWAQDYVGFPWVLNVKDASGNIEVSFEGFERL